MPHATVDLATLQWMASVILGLTALAVTVLITVLSAIAGDVRAMRASLGDMAAHAAVSRAHHEAHDKRLTALEQRTERIPWKA